MLYPACIETSATKTFGVVVPDLPGCFSAGDTLEEAMAMTEEAIVAWIETAIDAGQDIPQASSVEALRKAHKEWKAWTWVLVKVDPAALDDLAERRGTDWASVKREAEQDAPVPFDSESEPYNPNNPADVATYWESAAIKRGNDQAAAPGPEPDEKPAA